MWVMIVLLSLRIRFLGNHSLKILFNSKPLTLREITCSSLDLAERSGDGDSEEEPTDDASYEEELSEEV